MTPTHARIITLRRDAAKSRASVRRHCLELTRLLAARVPVSDLTIAIDDAEDGLLLADESETLADGLASLIAKKTEMFDMVRN